MQLLDITLPTLAENLALDDALLEEAEQADPVSASRETLRIWQPSAPMVVLGRSSRRADEVNLAACRRLGVPIFRRSSGGAAIAAASVNAHGGGGGVGRFFSRLFKRK
ncbi:MAG: hypothetical protein IID34_11635 [Planctomycetes bacterium]|nr:hypothetical protein [Planctomycetota bacterium]